MKYEIIYHSSAVYGLSRTAVLDILEVARQKNQQLGITGCLFFYENEFLQILEGEEAAVKALFDRIEQDPRHRNVMVLEEGPIEQATFSGWYMAFQHWDLRNSQKLMQYLEVESFAEFLEEMEKPSMAKKIFAAFSKNLLRR